MKLEINDTVVEILTQEAKDRETNVNQLVNDILKAVAMRSRYNNGQINSADIPSGLL